MSRPVLPEPFEKAAVRASLRAMFKGRHFNICTVNDCLKALGIVAAAHELDALRPLHCIDWADMGPALQQATLDRVLALFEIEPLDLELLEQAPLGEAPRPVARLLTGSTS